MANGMRVVMVKVPGLRSVTVRLLTRMGSRYEEVDEHGVAHLLEHMAFKGTRRIPDPVKLIEEFDSRGVEYNAETGLETVAYYLTTTRENVDWAVEMLREIFLESVYDEKEVKKEKEVVVEEICMYRDNPMVHVGNEAIKRIWGGNKIGCWDVIGEVGDVRGLSREKIGRFWQKMADPTKTVLVIAGGIRDEKLGEMTAGWEKWQNHTGSEQSDLKYNWFGYQTINKKTDQTHVFWAMKGIGILDKWWYEYRMWEMMMAGTTSSRLYRELRQSLGWGYYVHLAGENLADGGVWAIQTGVARENEKKVIEVIDREVRKSIEEGVREEELEAVRKNWRGRMSLAMDDSGVWAKVVSSGLLQRGELTNLQLEMEKYEKVKLRKINEIIREEFDRDSISTLTIS